MMMGIWLRASFFGNYRPGYSGRHYTRLEAESFFGIMIALSLAATGMRVLLPRRLRHAVRGALCQFAPKVDFSDFSPHQMSRFADIIASCPDLSAP